MKITAVYLWRLVAKQFFSFLLPAQQALGDGSCAFSRGQIYGRQFFEISAGSSQSRFVVLSCATCATTWHLGGPATSSNTIIWVSRGFVGAAHRTNTAMGSSSPTVPDITELQKISFSSDSDAPIRSVVVFTQSKKAEVTRVVNTSPTKIGLHEVRPVLSIQQYFL